MLLLCIKQIKVQTNPFVVHTDLSTYTVLSHLEAPVNNKTVHKADFWGSPKKNTKTDALPEHKERSCCYLQQHFHSGIGTILYMMPGKIQEAIEKIRQRGFTVHCFLFFCYCGVQPRSYIKPYVLNRLNMFVNSSTRNHACLLYTSPSPRD